MRVIEAILMALCGISGMLLLFFGQTGRDAYTLAFGAAMSIHAGLWRIAFVIEEGKP